jgi:hypothetical protein
MNIKANKGIGLRVYKAQQVLRILQDEKKAVIEERGNIYRFWKFGIRGYQRGLPHQVAQSPLLKYLLDCFDEAIVNYNNEIESLNNQIMLMKNAAPSRYRQHITTMYNISDKNESI